MNYLRNLYAYSLLNILTLLCHKMLHWFWMISSFFDGERPYIRCEVMYAVLLSLFLKPFHTLYRRTWNGAAAWYAWRRVLSLDSCAHAFSVTFPLLLCTCTYEMHDASCLVMWGARLHWARATIQLSYVSGHFYRGLRVPICVLCACMYMHTRFLFHTFSYIFCFFPPPFSDAFEPCVFLQCAAIGYSAAVMRVWSSCGKWRRPLTDMTLCCTHPGIRCL